LGNGSFYPYLIPQIKKIVGDKINIIDSGLAVAKQTGRVLEKNQLLNKTNSNVYNQFYSNTNTKVLSQVIEPSNTVKISYLDF
jgi:glutamate racemase